jgi:hypothetical protein
MQQNIHRSFKTEGNERLAVVAAAVRPSSDLMGLIADRFLLLPQSSLSPVHASCRGPDSEMHHLAPSGQFIQMRGMPVRTDCVDDCNIRS